MMSAPEVLIMNQILKDKDLIRANILTKLWIHKPAISG